MDKENIEDQIDMEDQTRITGMYKNWFLDYASYVILERAVPSIKDGLKPVQRRILHSMKEIEDGRYNKVANIIGNTMKYHPHGDVSIGDALVQVGQKEYLVDCQGNWGNVYTGDRAAASRYIEARLTKFALEVLFNSKTTQWLLSYDGRNKEPENLPVKFPLLLLQGVEGIAVGLACKMLPHNFNELIEASIKVLKNKPFEIYPDFPTAGKIDVSNYNNGLKGGKIKVRAKIEIEDKNVLSIREIPYSLNTNALIESILKANAKNKIKIKKIEDNTAENVDVKVYLPLGISPETAVEALYAFTDCEISISPNACVIEEDKPRFMGVKEILKISTFQTLELLRKEQLIKQEELQSQWRKLSLERLFIENKIYVKLHNLEYDEAIDLTKKNILRLIVPISEIRKIEHQDIVDLLEIKMRRITKHDTDQTNQKLLDIQTEIKQTISNIKNIIDFTIEYFQSIKKKYGQGKERKSTITEFQNINLTEVVINNVKLYVNKQEGFVGYDLNKKEADCVCDCSDMDDIIVVLKSGLMSVSKISKKNFVGKDILYTGVWKKTDANVIYNMVYRDGEKGINFYKRFSVTAITREVKYDLTKGTLGSKVLFFSANLNGETEQIEIKLKKTQYIRKQILTADFSELLVKGRNAIGNILTKHSISSIKVKKEKSELTYPLKVYYNEELNRLNFNQKGICLGDFIKEDNLVEITKLGIIRSFLLQIDSSLSNDVLDVSKLDENTIFSVIYFDGEKEKIFLKRFKILKNMSYCSFITRHPKSILLDVTTGKHPLLNLVFKKKNNYQRPSEFIKAEDIVKVKGIKALGNRVSRHEISEIFFMKNNIALKEKKIMQKKIF